MDSREPGRVDVLYHFMNTIVVQFSTNAEKGFNGADSRSTLSHASEKAVDAYFGLYHLLLCLATEDSRIVAGAGRIVARFAAGPRGKTHFADLGHVLVAAIISTNGLTEQLSFLVIKEAILRNVVWMLDAKGAGFTELAYLEPSDASDYRLVKTFAASPTSYRLLMFLKLFSSAARPAGKTLVEMRDMLFDTHDAPPNGLSATMAQSIRKIHEIDAFPSFITAMGIRDMPPKTLSSVEVGENHVVLGYGRERPMYSREYALVLMGKCVRANMRWNLGQTVPVRAGDPTADKISSLRSYAARLLRV